VADTTGSAHGVAGPGAGRALRLVEVVAIGIIAAGFQLPFFDRAMFLMDEGHILQFADMLANGGELYRDASLLPLPGAFYLLAAAFKLFGASIAVARWISLIEFSLLCVFGFVLLRHLVSRPFAYAGLLVLLVYRLWAFPHWHMYSYSTMSLCWIAGGLVLLMGFIETQQRWRIALAGLATGFAVACKQDYGVASLVAMSVLLLIRHRTASAQSPERGIASFGWYIGPAALVGAVVAIHYLQQGLFGEMLQHTLFNHLRGIATFEYPTLPPIFPLFAQEPLFRESYGYAAYVPSVVFQLDWEALRASAFYNDTYIWDVAIKLFFFAPYGVVAFGAVRMWRLRSRARDPRQRTAFLCEFALYLTASALVLSLNKPVDFVHVVVLYWPLLLLAVVYLAALCSGRPRIAWTLGALSLLPVLAVVGYTASLAQRLNETYQTPLRGERAGVRVLADEERVIGSMVDWVRSHSAPGETFAVLPYFPLISFLADRDGPHRAAYTLWPIEYIPGRERQIIEAIEASGNERLLYHFTQFIVFPRMPEYAPELFAYLVARYEIERVFTSGSWGYMAAGIRRSPESSPGEAVIDIDDPSVELWIETDGKPNQPVGTAGRGELFATAKWPFRPVFTLRPLSGQRRSVAAISLDVPKDARLQSSVSVHPEKWFNHPPSSVTFGVRARVAGELQSLYRRTIRPQQDYLDRHWFDFEIDLSAFAGREIQLEFTTECERPSGELLSMGGFEIPRLLSPAAGGSRPDVTR
jgi:hypothetical protein